eukprot:scaffold39573_cov28-Tisochrysis_lutea.AAC.1
MRPGEPALSRFPQHIGTDPERRRAWVGGCMFYHAAPQHSMRVKNHTDPRVDTYGNVFEVALALDLDNDEFL